MWITFKSCIFAFWNNVHSRKSIIALVVNYIQILYLCILKQQERKTALEKASCELHSNLVSLHSETTNFRLSRMPKSLWITFKSCIFAFWNNTRNTISPTAVVVNYIQILYLCILKQLGFSSILQGVCCELHSNLVSLHSETTFISTMAPGLLLWITFKSCIFAFWNNHVDAPCSWERLWITFKSCIFAFWNNHTDFDCVVV